MSSHIKSMVSKEETFDKLDIRLGQIVDIHPEPSAPNAAYRLTVDFGKYGRRVSVGRFTKHAIEEIKGR
jgi:tRNA-binding protein